MCDDSVLRRLSDFRGGERVRRHESAVPLSGTFTSVMSVLACVTVAAAGADLVPTSAANGRSTAVGQTH
jgi:hypothetical protein